MNRIFLITVFTMLTLFSYQQITFAVCSQGPPNTFTCDTDQPNPDPNGIQQGGNDNNLIINVLEGAGIDTLGTPNADCIDTGEGNNNFDINGADLKCESTGIDATGGDMTINITDTSILTNQSFILTGGGDDRIDILRVTATLENEAIDAGSGNDIITITDSSLIAGDSAAIELGFGSDTVNMLNVLRSRVECVGNCEAIEGSSARENITIEESTVRSLGDDSVSMGSNNDTLTLGTGADMQGLIDCGSGFDTLIFAMDVPPERLNFLSGQLAIADPQSGSITINGLFYEWDRCDLIVNELKGVQMTRPIPTLSQWGLIAMAGIIGLAGFIAVRKKYSTA